MSSKKTRRCRAGHQLLQTNDHRETAIVMTDYDTPAEKPVCERTRGVRHEVDLDVPFEDLPLHTDLPLPRYEGTITWIPDRDLVRRFVGDCDV